MDATARRTHMRGFLGACAAAEPPTIVEGRAISMRFDPNRVAGLPAAGGPRPACRSSIGGWSR